MGCDFSNEVKEDFYKKTAKINKTRHKILKKQRIISSYFQEFNDITDCSEDTDNISKDLQKSLRKVKNILKDIKSAQRSKSIEKLNENPQKLLLKTPENYSTQISEKDSIQSPKGRNSVFKQSPRPESILEDPEIISMIMKNRQLLMRQLTK
jgi:hypothetical protein